MRHPYASTGKAKAGSHSIFLAVLISCEVGYDEQNDNCADFYEISLVFNFTVFIFHHNSYKL
jgi:hypothetical protein